MFLIPIIGCIAQNPEINETRSGGLTYKEKKDVNKTIRQTNTNTANIALNGAALAPVANAQTDTLYTFVLADANKIVTFNNADTVDVTVPPNSGVAFPVGTVLDFIQLGAGPVIIGPGSGVTLHMYNSDSIMSGQYAVGSVWQYSANTWLLFGNF